MLELLIILSPAESGNEKLLGNLIILDKERLPLIKSSHLLL